MRALRLFGRQAPPPDAPHVTALRPFPLKVLRADGQRIDLTRRETGLTLVATRQPWQQLSWSYRDLIGELRYAIRLLSRATARARFYPAQIKPWPDDPAPLDGKEHDLDKQLAADAMHNFDRLPLDANPDGFTARLVENLSVAGESWVHVDPDDKFWVRSTSEITATADGRVMLNTLPSANSTSMRAINPDTEDLLRLWVPHPEWGLLADSPLRCLLDVCEDVVIAGREQRSAARSRVAANGILLLPSTLSLVKTRDEDEDLDDSVTSDTFMADFTAAMLAPIRDDGDAQAVVPIVIRGDKDDLDGVKHLTLQREDSAKLIDRQSAAILRLLRGLDVQPEQVQGIGGVNHWCVDHETEALTTRGWVNQSDLQIGDTILTLNHETGLSEWQPVRKVYRADVTDETMIAMAGKRHSSLTTLGHRWPIVGLRGGYNRNVAGELIDGRHIIRDWVTSETLTVRDSIPTCAPSADRPTQAKYTDEFVELVGWYWTEGSLRDKRTATIAQSHTRNPERVARIRSCLTRLYGRASENLYGREMPPRWRECVQLNRSSYGGPITVFALCHRITEQLNGVAPEKIVSREFVQALTPAQLEMFIDISAQGDGWHYRSGRLDMWQRNPAALEAYELALILSGRMVTRGTSSGGYWVAPHTSCLISPSKACNEARRQGRGPLVTRQRYTGTVWCPTTTNGTWFARRHGTTYFTGNSAWIIDAQSIKHQVQPMAETVAACLLQAFLRPALLSLKHDPDLVNQVTIAVDITALAEDPNRSQVATEAHDREVISDEALREAMGFDDDDKPDEFELIRRSLTKGRITPQAIPLIIKALDGQLPDATDIANATGQLQPHPIVINGEPVSAPALPAGQSKRPAASPTQTVPNNPVPAAPGTPGGPVTASADPVLVERITVAADAAVARVLERAGARVRTATRNNRALAASLAGVEAHLIPAQLGRQQVETFLPTAELLAGGYTRLETQVRDWLTAAGITDVERAWKGLATVLDAAAERAMFAPNAGPGDMLVDRADIERALS